jgi:BirA family transcriptional regulator, biotin operon repressor / biotin---[acetyl-CoA-carboxylase] ligase
MDLSPDLRAEALAEALGERPFRTYPALLSTEADAVSWARSAAPAGALVVADYQIAARGRGAWPWKVAPGQGLSFSLVLRPRLRPEREGWLYTVATSALADLCGPDATIAWPDEVRRNGVRAAAVAVRSDLGPQASSWAVVSVHLLEAPPPRGELLGRIATAIEARAKESPAALLDEYTRRCETIGRRVCARLIPLGPKGEKLTGTAVRTLEDGALSLETADGRRMAVLPQHLGLLDDAPAPEAASNGDREG